MISTPRTTETPYRPVKTGFRLATNANVAVVSGRPAFRLGGRLHLQRPRELSGGGQLPLDLRVGGGGPGRQPAGQFPRGTGHLVVGVDQGGEQADPACLLGPHRFGEHQQLGGPGVTHQPREGPGDRGVGGEPDVGERHQEARRRAADPEVGQERQARTGAGGHAAHRRHHRLGHPGQRPHDRVVVRHHRAQRRTRTRLQGRDVLPQVLPDAEGAAGASQHHRPYRAFAGECRELVAQRLLEGCVQRVQRVGPVEGEGGDGAVAFHQQ
jgi:hypothetical protein